jgi:hypothetical protein
MGSHNTPETSVCLTGTALLKRGCYERAFCRPFGSRFAAKNALNQTLAPILTAKSIPIFAECAFEP